MIKAIQAKPGAGMTFSPSPAPTSPSESVAAPADVGQVAGTPTLEQFQRWLEDTAHAACRFEWPARLPGESQSNHEFRCISVIHSLRKATALLIAFKR